MATPISKKIKVTGHLQERASTNGKKQGKFYRMMLAWTDENGEGQRKSFTTGLPTKGNKGRAEDMLRDKIAEWETILNEALQARELVDAATQGVLFADFIEHDWLEAVRRGDRKAVKKKIALTTFGGYQLNVQASIAPYFRDKGILLTELTADNINDFYDFHYERAQVSQLCKKYGIIK